MMQHIKQRFTALALVSVTLLAACGQNSPTQKAIPTSDSTSAKNNTTNVPVTMQLETHSYADLPAFLDKNPEIKEMLRSSGNLDKELAHAAQVATQISSQQAVPYVIPGCSLVLNAQYDDIGKRVYSWGDMTCAKSVTSGYIQLTGGQVSPSTGPTTVKQFDVRGPTTQYTTRPGGVSVSVVAGGTACTQAYAFMNYSDRTYGAGVSPQNACDSRPLIP
jgi:hypothetical protein